jgi:Tfp pilus assembly protein PilV
MASLAEVMVSVVVVTIVALGGLSYQYHAARHARIARAQITATRTAQLLLEDWKSTGGSSEYDPAALGIGISFAGAVSIGSYDWDTTLGGGAYSTNIDGLPMVIMLGFRDVEYDEDAQVKLRQLTVVIQSAEISAATKELIISPGASGLFSPIVMTTYSRADASNG